MADLQHKLNTTEMSLENCIVAKVYMLTHTHMYVSNILQLNTYMQR